MRRPLVESGQHHAPVETDPLWRESLGRTAAKTPVPSKQVEGEGIVHATRNSGMTCVRQFGPYLP